MFHFYFIPKHFLLQDFCTKKKKKSKYQNQVNHLYNKLSFNKFINKNKNLASKKFRNGRRILI